MIDQVRSSGRPVVLTQRGRAAVVLLDVAAYEALLAENEILRDIIAGWEDRETGRVVSQEAARTRVPTRLG